MFDASGNEMCTYLWTEGVNLWRAVAMNMAVVHVACFLCCSIVWQPQL